MPNAIDDYISSFPQGTRRRLKELRRLVRELAPDAQERISYQMPGIFLDGALVYFAAFPRHIGFYPGSSGISKFKAELSRYKTGKGSIQFPLDQELPTRLIQRIVKFRIEENRKKKR